MKTISDDAELLQRYARQGAEAAFAELIRRHVNLVWAAARRITGDGDQARDVAQTVFADLARKARRLPANIILPGWLHGAACLAAANLVRGNACRVARLPAKPASFLPFHHFPLIRKKREIMLTTSARV